MKLRYLKFAFISALLTLPAVAAADSAPVVTNFAQTAVLGRAGALEITDNIDYAPAGSAADLVYTVPLNYHDDQGREYRMSFKLLSAQADGQDINISPVVTPQLARLSLPDGTAAPRHFTLRFNLSPVVLRGSDADVLRLSVTGLSWTVPIQRASLRLQSPMAPADNLTCYTGSQGSTTSTCTVTQSGNISNISTDSALGIGDGLSIYANFPTKSLSAYLAPYEPHPFSLASLIWILVGGLAAFAVVLGAIIWFWQRKRYTKTNEAARHQAD